MVQILPIESQAKGYCQCKTLFEEACTQLGVPQGSILGTILFIIFINDFSDKIEHHTINYADDFNLTLNASSFPEISNLVQSTLEQTIQWFQSNSLCMNVDKTCGIFLKTAHAGFLTPSDIQLSMTTNSHCKTLAASQVSQEMKI